jgi:hypothetical protein
MDLSGQGLDRLVSDRKNSGAPDHWYLAGPVLATPGATRTSKSSRPPVSEKGEYRALLPLYCSPIHRVRWANPSADSTERERRPRPPTLHPPYRLPPLGLEQIHGAIVPDTPLADLLAQPRHSAWRRCQSLEPAYMAAMAFHSATAFGSSQYESAPIAVEQVSARAVAANSETLLVAIHTPEESRRIHSDARATTGGIIRPAAPACRGPAARRPPPCKSIRDAAGLDWRGSRTAVQRSRTRSSARTLSQAT